MMTVTALVSDAEIGASYPVMAQLRPDLGQAEYLSLVRSLQATEGLRLLAVRDQDRICAVATYRIIRMLYCDRILVVDDLVTDQARRSQGVGSRLMDALKHVARTENCKEVQLISRTTREEAHRFYFRHGFGIECFHLRWKVTAA